MVLKSMEEQKKLPPHLIPLIVLAIYFSAIVGVFLGIRYLVITLFVRVVCWVQGVRGILLYSRHPAWVAWSNELTKSHRLVPLIWDERKAWYLSPATLLLYATVRSHSSLKKDQNNPRNDMYPSAVIFGRSFFPTTIRFAQAWQKKFKGDETVLKAQRNLLRDCFR